MNRQNKKRKKKSYKDEDKQIREINHYRLYSLGQILDKSIPLKPSLWKFFKYLKKLLVLLQRNNRQITSQQCINMCMCINMKISTPKYPLF